MPHTPASADAASAVHAQQRETALTAKRHESLQRGVLAGIIALGALILVVVLVFVAGGDETSAPDAGGAQSQRTQQPSTGGRPSGRPHVLFLIDLSQSMRTNDLNPGVPDQGTRIENALEFVSHGIEFGKRYERVGVWLVTSSPQAVPEDCAWVPRPPRTPRMYCVMRPLKEASERDRVDLAGQVSDLHANGGGNALYRAMADAVRTVRRDWIATGRDRAVVPSVVVITDGLNNRRLARGSLSSLAAAAGDDVQVLITAFDKRLCDGELADNVKRYFGWYVCLPVASIPAAVRARKKIGSLLITRASRSK